MSRRPSSPSTDMEIWKPIPKWEGRYEVSSHGRVRSLPRMRPYGTGKPRPIPGKLLGDNGYGHLNAKGYRFVILCDGDSQPKFLIHRIVCDVFCGGLAEGQVVLHLNDDPSDNRSINVHPGSQADNISDCISKGRFNAGAANRMKTHCPRGHEYATWNLCGHGKPVKRACLSCHRAHGRVARAKRRGEDVAEEFVRISHEIYESLKNENA